MNGGSLELVGERTCRQGGAAAKIERNGRSAKEKEERTVFLSIYY